MDLQIGQNFDVALVGGGVIGMACADELSRRGLKVVVIEKGDVGHGCSYGNAGWVTPCFAMPLPMPGMLLKSIQWLLDPVGPLYIKPEPSLTLLRWLSRFLISMRRGLAQSSIEALVGLSQYSLQEYARLNEELGGAIRMERRGLLMVGQSRDGKKAAQNALDWVSRYGVSGKVVNEAEARSLEPALVGRMEGGVFFPNEAHVEPLEVVRALEKRAVANGAVILRGVEAFDFECDSADRRVRFARTTHGPIHATNFVLCAGTWSNRIARRMGLRVPVLGGKGYAWVIPKFNPTPTRPILLVEKKVAVTPRENSVRLAGTLELVNQDFSITPARVDAIVSGAREFMNVPESPQLIELWRGLRPCTPDGVPIIGFSPRHANLLFATGHQMLGLQSAPGTGRLAADLILGVTPVMDPRPFRMERFNSSC